MRLNHATAALSVGSVADLANLDWDAGALSVTAQEVAVESAGLFDNVLIVGEDQALHVPNNSLTVGPSASSNVIRGLLSTGSAVNNGLTILAEADGVDFDADNDGIGFTNNSDLVVVDTTVAGNVTNNGRIEMLGNVTFLDDLALQPGGSVDFDLGGTAAGQFDALTILGDFTLDGLLSVTLDSGFSLTVGDSFDIIDTGGAVSGTFTGLADGALVGSFGGVDLFIEQRRFARHGAWRRRGSRQRRRCGWSRLLVDSADRSIADPRVGIGVRRWRWSRFASGRGNS